MLRAITLAIALFVMPTICWAEACPQQVVTTSWPGLSGLYIIPTARIIGPSKLGVGFNESKHAEFINNGRFVDRQIRGVLTYGITDKLEVYASNYNDLYVIPPGINPQLDNQSFWSFGAKLQILQEHPHYWFPAVALAVRDIANNTANVGPLTNVNNGTMGFILASKKVLKDDKIGRFMDCHAGLTFNRTTTAGLAGFELTLAPNVSLIAESIWDSPYLNFHNFGKTDQKGRYLFNTGIRMYPELVPGLVLDTGFIGDGEFEFSFAASYVISL
jgi:hypothetical protein